ncbi:complement C1q tumor necrosis factor-related protein 6-like [Mytilus edulis]|uniref:complement C1q tumor necrosis factor-related protein 6-like n=1 Tax=Mytilus edulis TaxID=6550 RepID=UPI0039F08492
MVGFLAKSSGHQSDINAGSMVILDRIVTNTGSGYDASTGQFIAPDEGLYFFTCTTPTAPLKYFITDIMHIGRKVASNQSDGRGLSNAHMSSTQSIVLQLTEKDKVYIF